MSNKKRWVKLYDAPMDEWYSVVTDIDRLSRIKAAAAKEGLAFPFKVSREPFPGLPVEEKARG